jgi:hypothetical protein
MWYRELSATEVIFTYFKHFGHFMGEIVPKMAAILDFCPFRGPIFLRAPLFCAHLFFARPNFQILITRSTNNIIDAFFHQKKDKKC